MAKISISLTEQSIERITNIRLYFHEVHGIEMTVSQAIATAISVMHLEYFKTTRTDVNIRARAKEVLQDKNDGGDKVIITTTAVDK